VGEQNSGTGESASRIRTTPDDNRSNFLPLVGSLRGFHWPFFGAARVMDSSVYHLASALNSRRLGRMTPRS
jgi:hypothetical protein